MSRIHGIDYGATQPQDGSLRRLAIITQAFPVAGGIRSVLSQVHTALGDRYDIHYVTHHVGLGAERFHVHHFGSRIASPYSFPDALIYCFSGFWHLWRLQRRCSFAVLIAQDGGYTGLFTAIVGRLTRTRVIIMDHGTAVLATQPQFRTLKAHSQASLRPPENLLHRLHRFSKPLRKRLHMAALPAIVRVTSKLSSEYLLVGQEEVEVYHELLGVSMDQIAQYTYTVDTTMFQPASASGHPSLRRALGLPEDGIVIAMVNRLAPEKGLEKAILGIAAAMKAANRASVLVIGGTGPLLPVVRQVLVDADIADRAFLLGELSREEVARLLSVSDIFVYSGIHGTNISAAVLEAMASGCATIATPAPLSNEVLLGEGRGVIIPVGDALALKAAILELITNDQRRRDAAVTARSYVNLHHTLPVLRRMLEHV
jgi:glycosyltransferase involved in cell wall biosynthesis